MRLQVALLWYSLPTSALGRYTDGHYKVQWILTSIKLISGYTISGIIETEEKPVFTKSYL